MSTIRPADFPYRLFALAGLISSGTFAQAIGAFANSLIENSNLLTKVSSRGCTPMSYARPPEAA